jgi:hypothetical protein
VTLIILLAAATAAVLIGRRRTNSRPATLLTFRITVTKQAATDGEARHDVLNTHRVISLPTMSTLLDLTRKSH